MGPRGDAGSGGAAVRIVELFGGAGGWAEGLRLLGLSGVGLEIDPWACATRAAAGHPTIRADVAAYPPEAFAGVEGLIASPPCQDFSAAGKRAGIDGERGHLLHEVMRWSRALRPRWIACEQVPPVLPYWEVFAHELRGLGYSTWTGLLNAADYGVPQTRVRAFLLAHRERPALPPEPTHCRSGREADLFRHELLPWVSMAEALGWNGRLWTHSGNGYAHDYERATERPATTVASRVNRWRLHTNRDQRENGDRLTVSVDRPAPSVPGTFGTGKIAPPGHQTTSNFEGPQSVRVTVREAAILQGFRPDYPWQGTKTAKFTQIGNAVPPPLTAAVIRALVGH